VIHDGWVVLIVLMAIDELANDDRVRADRGTLHVDGALVVVDHDDSIIVEDPTYSGGFASVQQAMRISTASSVPNVMTHRVASNFYAMNDPLDHAPICHREY